MGIINIGMWKMYSLFGVLSIIASQSGVNAKASCRKVVKDLILPPHTKLAQNSKNKGRFRDVKLVCENGYFFAKRISTKVIKCKNGVIRTNPIPKCGGCGVPRNISNGTATFSSTAVKSHVTYSCDVGFTLVGQKERRCRQRLKWSGKEPFCERNQCPAPRRLTISNGNVTSTDPFYHDLATLSFECNDGYELRGDRDIVCQDKVWSGRFPFCKKKRCPKPGSPDNGRLYGNRFYIGSTVEFFCNSGFTLYGSPKRTCQADLSWSGTLSTCDDGRFHCRDPGTPIGSTKDGKIYNLGDTVKYRCKAGYRLEGSHTRTCLQNKTWSGDQPKCVDANKIIFPSLNETMEYLREGFVDSLLQTTCSGKNITCPKLDPRARALNTKRKTGLDLIFVLDGSSSISKKNFIIAKGFLKTIVKIFGVSTRPDGTRIACVVFGTKAKLEFSFNDYTVSTKERALKRIDEIPRIRGGTATWAALDEVRKTILASGKNEEESEEGRTQALFLITDGNSNIGSEPRKAAQALRDKGVEIYVVGVGNEVNRRSLKGIALNKDIASKKYIKEHFFTIENYEELEKVKKWIAITPGRDYSQCGRAHFKNAVVLDNRARIVGGSKTKEDLWPWAVRIYVKNERKHKCGGTLINQEFVLTAAHCFKGEEPQQVKVAFGDKDRTTETSLEIYIHPKYDARKFINDIALVKIKKLERYSRGIQAICLPRGLNTTHIIKPGNSLFAVGWGITKRMNKGAEGHQNDYSNELKQVEIPFINDTKCADNVDNKRAERVDKWENWYFSSDTQFCAADISGQNDTCQGDSGGPAMVLVKEPVTNKPRWYQVGIVSWGHGCAQAGEYGYYSKVPAFLDWVDKKIKL